MKHIKKSNLIKSLIGTISVWDLLAGLLDSENLQAFAKELSIILMNLKIISKSLKIVSKCESNPIDSSQMVNLL